MKSSVLDCTMALTEFLLSIGMMHRCLVFPCYLNGLSLKAVILLPEHSIAMGKVCLLR